MSYHIEELHEKVTYWVANPVAAHINSCENTYRGELTVIFSYIVSKLLQLSHNFYHGLLPVVVLGSQIYHTERTAIWVWLRYDDIFSHGNKSFDISE